MRGGLWALVLSITLIFMLVPAVSAFGGGGCSYYPACPLGQPGTGGCDACRAPQYATACDGGCNSTLLSCVYVGVCTPSTHQSCGTSGTQTCTASCTWGPCQYDCSPPNCDDRLPCQTGTCHANNQCSYTPVTDGTLCGTDQKCESGMCKATCVSPYFCAPPTPPHSTLFDQYYCVGTPKCYACQSGYHDVGGQCVATCTDQCPSPGAVTCLDNTHNETCADWNSDGCLEWGGTQTCPDGTTCNNGACVAMDPCAAYPGYQPCSVAGSQQCSANSVQTCNYFGTSCLHWNTIACATPTPYCFATPPTATCVETL